jgi:predicted nucleic acid-binding protein
MIVVDTTVWIDFFEGRGTRFDEHLTALIAGGVPLALTDLIYCEILQGIADQALYERTRDLLQAHPIFLVRGLGTFERAANIYRACRKRGLTVRKTADCVIAATCLEADAELYHNDRDFDAIAKVEGVRIYRVPSGARG